MKSKIIIAVGALLFAVMLQLINDALMHSGPEVGLGIILVGLAVTFMVARSMHRAIPTKSVELIVAESRFKHGLK